MITVASITFLPNMGTYISEWYAGQNFAYSQALFVSQFQQTGDKYRSLLRFDLSGIPKTSTIEKAELLLTLYRNEVTSNGIYVSVHRLLNKWLDHTVTWDTQPPFSPFWDGDLGIDQTTPLGLYSIDISDLVRGWYDGSIPNNGLLLSGSEDKNDLIAFRSANYLYSNDWPKLAIKFVDGILEIKDEQEIIIPACPETPIIESNPVALGPRKKATFMILNTSNSSHVKVKIQLGFDNDPDAVFFDAGPWHCLEPQGYPGEALAISTSEAAEYARVLFWGEGGETLIVYPRTKEP